MDDITSDYGCLLLVLNAFLLDTKELYSRCRKLLQGVTRCHKGAYLSGQRFVLGNQSFPVQVQLLGMCRGEQGACLMFNCLPRGGK